MLFRTPLRYGFTIIPSEAPPSLFSARSSIQSYFHQPENYKKLHQRIDHAELGYRDLMHKETFMVRESHLPNELLPCLPLANDLHHIGLQCLRTISKELQWDENLLSNLVDVCAIPTVGIAHSVLRLIHYRKSHSILNPACNIHQDLGLLTLVCFTGVPALEVYDYTHHTEWIDLELNQGKHDIIVLVGESLSLISNHYFLPASHRVRASNQDRLSILYQLRFKHDAMIDSTLFETPITGKFNQSFCMTGKDYLESEIKIRQSVNGSY